MHSQAKLEAQHNSRRENIQQELSDARAQLEKKSHENKVLSASTDSLRNANEELKVSGGRSPGDGQC